MPCTTASNSRPITLTKLYIYQLLQICTTLYTKIPESNELHEKSTEKRDIFYNKLLGYLPKTLVAESGRTDGWWGQVQTGCVNAAGPKCRALCTQYRTIDFFSSKPLKSAPVDRLVSYRKTQRKTTKQPAIAPLQKDRQEHKKYINVERGFQAKDDNTNHHRKTIKTDKPKQLSKPKTIELHRELADTATIWDGLGGVLPLWGPP